MFPMKMKFIQRVYLLSMLILSGSVMAVETVGDEGNKEPEEEITVIEHRDKPVTIPQSPGSHQIRDWYAPDSKTLIIDMGGRGKYKATFMMPCIGIRVVDQIGFATMGPFMLDRTTTVILPDGLRCHFKELVKYSKEDEQRDKEARLKKKAEKKEPADN